MDEPLVSVIVVNWNGEKVLPEFFASLKSQEYNNWELIFVDNASSDKSIALFEKFASGLKNNLVLIRNSENLGFVGGNNTGFNQTRGKYILLVNNDTKFSEKLFGGLVGKMESDKSIGALQPKILMMDEPDTLDNAGSFITRIGFFEHWGFGQKDGEEFSREREIFAAKGACLITRRKLVEKVGLFDPDYFSYFEETDFCWRVWLAGYRVIYFPEAEIFHKVGYTIKRLDSVGLNYHYYKNRIVSLIKNLEIRNLAIMLPVHLVVSIGIAAAFLFKANPAGALNVIKAIAWNAVHFPETLRKRKRVQRLRKVDDREVFSKLMFGIEWREFYRSFLRVSNDMRVK